MFGRQTPVTYAHEYQQSICFPLVIYCRPPNPVLGPQENPKFDTPEYVQKLENNHARLVEEYDKYFSSNEWGFPQLTFDWTNQEKVLTRCKIHCRTLR